MFRNTILALGAIFLSTSFVSAAPIQAITEGTRPTVLGTQNINGDTKGPNGFELMTLDAVGETIDIYGRIVGAIDFFQITSETSFRIDWIFGGYQTGTDNAPVNVADSGFVRESGGNNAVEFSLLGAGGPFLPIANPYTTNITSLADNGGTSRIFDALGAGTYVLKIDNINPDDPALYDLRITAVPLPAGVVLLLSGLGIMGAARMRRKA